MGERIEAQMDELQRMITTELVARFQELRGDPCWTRNRQYLIKRNTWRIQVPT